MSNTTTTAVASTSNGFEADLLAAREALAGLKGGSKRVATVEQFLAAKTDDERQAVVDGLNAGEVRRELRQVAIRMERAGKQEAAEVFLALRDDIDEDGDVFRIDPTAEFAVEVEVEDEPVAV
jgi:hypothetical protein